MVLGQISNAAVMAKAAQQTRADELERPEPAGAGKQEVGKGFEKVPAGMP